MTSFRFNLTFAIVSTLACLLLLSWILLSLISFKTAEQDLQAQKIAEGRLLADTVSAAFPRPFSPETVAITIARLTPHLSTSRGVHNLAVIDSSGQLLIGGPADKQLRQVLLNGEERRQFDQNGRLLHCYVPIMQADSVVGALRISYSLDNDYERLNRSRRLFMAYFILDFFLLLVIGSALTRRIVVLPVQKLLAATERVAAGDLSQGVHVPGSAEIAALAESFNSMVSALRRQREEGERHVASLEQVNRQLQSAREETIRSEKMASVGVLAAGMAHEIGTPLAAILGYVEIMQDGPVDPDDTADCLRRIDQEARRIDRLVRELLDFSRPTEAEQELLNLSEFLADVLDMLTRQGALKQLTTSITVGDDLPLLYIDRHQLLQVLLNLLLNARDAMPGGGELQLNAERAEFSANEAWALPASGATMGRRREDFGGVFRQPFPVEPDAAVPCVRITVADTGSGIQNHQLPRIFDPFFTTKEPGKGTGLGLAITARLVDSFGGRITVASTAGSGTRFMVWLPVDQQQENR